MRRINISDITIDSDKVALPKSAIKINLMNETSKEEVVTPTLISNLGASSLREGATKIYETRNIHKNGNNEISTTYRLRAWIDKSYTIDSSKTYQYKFSVNINSQVGALINHE